MGDRRNYRANARGLAPVAVRGIELSTGLAIAACQLPSAVLAQEQPDATAAGGLEEIVVTARKREENLQDVATSVSALGS